MRKFSFLILVCSSLSYSQETEADAPVAADAPPISSIDISMLDASFNSQPLDKWLVDQLGEEWKITPTQSLTDCGEQSGTPGQNDFPLCVEIKLTNKSEVGFLHVSVGTYKTGVGGKPQFFFGVINGEFFYNLSELQSASAL